VRGDKEKLFIQQRHKEVKHGGVGGRQGGK